MPSHRAAIAIVVVVLATILGGALVGGWSAPAHGASYVHAASYVYDGTTLRPAQESGPSAAAVTGGPVRVRPSSAVRGAAEDAGASVLRHYTTADAAKAITESGRIEPGAASGKIWLTPDEYASGADARSALALNKTPEGCFEIPLCRVSGLSPPGRVAPAYGEAGGGVEVTTSNAIDVTGLIFRPFGPR